MSTLAQSLRSWAVQDVVVDRRARLAVGAVAFALATAFGAQIAVPVPLTPVPVTLQTLFVILAGVVLGPRAGAVSMALYVGAGALGAPVFSNGGAGLPWLLGPTGGYLLMFPASAFIAGWVAGRRGSMLRLLVGLTLGVLMHYAGGLARLAALTGQPLGTVVAMGAVPFLFGDAVKIVTAAWFARGLRATSFGTL
ncbi:MAG: biotin transporter BioY [Gemmatimonadetes bacterium]|nr:biotin transporter BioY [Gemmatimonadota bacterium]